MEKLAQVISYTTIPFAFFLAVQKAVYLLVSLPKHIEDIKNAPEKRKAEALYLSNYVSCFHSFVIIIFAGWFSLTRKSGVPANSFDEELVIYVTC